MKTRISSQRNCRGIALMIVMLVIFVLSGMIAAFAFKMRVELQLARNDNNESQLEWEARGAVEWAKFAITHKCPNMAGIDTLNDAWAGGIGCADDPVLGLVDLQNISFGPLGTASVKITDMERKWNINMLANPRPPGPQPEIIMAALASMGMTDPADMSTISDSILDWVDPGDKARFNGAKNDYYLHLDPPYFCKNGYIDDISEMLRVKGVLPEMVSATNVSMSAYQMHTSPFPRDWVPPTYLTHFDEIFSTMGARLNVNTASREALRLIPGIDDEMADSIVRGRAGEDGVEGTEDDTPYRSPMEALTRGLTGMGMGVPMRAPMGGGGPGGSRPGGIGPGGMGSGGLGGPGGFGMGMAQRFLDVSSQYFEVKVDAQVGDYRRTYYAVLYRPRGREPVIIKFYSN